MQAQGAVLLGGDAQMEFTYRFADRRRAGLDGGARGAGVGDRRFPLDGGGRRGRRRPSAALTQVKAVDGAYPLIGAVVLDPPMPLAEALAGARRAARRGGGPGAGRPAGAGGRRHASARDGRTSGWPRGSLREPDSAAGGFGFGPRTIVRPADLAGSGLLEPGSLFDNRLPAARCPRAPTWRRCRRAARRAFRDTGLRWHDRAPRRAGGRALRRPDRARSWCWSGWPGWRWAASASRRRCAPISTARPRPSPR